MRMNGYYEKCQSSILDELKAMNKNLVIQNDIFHRLIKQNNILLEDRIKVIENILSIKG
jgi:hypothetical protein